MNGYARPIVSAVVPALAGLLLLGCSHPIDTTWCNTGSPQTEVVLSSGPGAWEHQGLSPELHELWRRGGLREGENLAFPVGASVSPDGRLAIADFRLAELVVIEPDGTWLGPWGVRGEGPGELSTPVAANWDRGDGALAVLDFGRAKVVFLGDGEPVRDDVHIDPAPLAPILASGEMLWAGVQPSGGVLVEPLPRPSPDGTGDRTAVILRLPPGAGAEDTLARGRSVTVGGSPLYASLEAPGWPRLVAAVGTDGTIALGGLDVRYRVLLLDANGRLRRVVCRDASALPLSDRELAGPPRDEDAKAAEAALRQAPKPDSLAPYGDLFLGARGRLWVQRERPAPLKGEGFLGVPGATWDVFDADGQYLGRVKAPEGARLQAASGDTVWAYEIGDFDETSVIAYRLSLQPQEAS